MTGAEDAGNTVREALHAYSELFDEAIERWHKGTDDRPAHEYLGLTFEQYALIVEVRGLAALDTILARVSELEEALAEARPYVYNVYCDPANAPWRRETAEAILASVDAALGRDGRADQPDGQT